MPDHEPTLVVILHAFTSSPARMEDVRRTVEVQIPNARCYVPPLPLGLFSFADLDKLADRLGQKIERKIAAAPEIRRVVLVGHSMGSLIARKTYLLSVAHHHQWPKLLDRIVLLAGMNRGWSVTHHLSLKSTFLLVVGSAFGTVMWAVARHRLTIFQMRRGAPFLTQLRLEWIDLAQKPLVVQLLGTIDDMVSPEDNIDLVTGRDFLFLDVPQTGHTNVIEMDETPAGKQRRAVFTLGLIGAVDQIRAASILPVDTALSQADPATTNVIFVIHGIRDVGYWTQKIARRVQAIGNRPPRIYASETSTYGYFPMLSFLLPTKRRAKLEWLMDQYVEARSLYPSATFSYVGHSHGTYLLAKALEEYPSCRFEHVVFAGSVVRTDYDWKARIAVGQVKTVLNYVATADWVVAFFPGALELLRLQDLGSAGHNGFRQAAPSGPVYERRFVAGRHSAAIAEGNWEEIARFIVNGTLPDLPATPLKSRRSWLIVGLGRVAPLIWGGLVWLVYWVATKIWSIPDTDEWVRTAILGGFCWLIVKVLTKF